MPRSLRINIRLLAFALVAAVTAGRAPAATINVSVNANVVKPLTLTTKQDLDFGQILLSGAGGTVSISTAGVRTCPAGLTCSGTARQAIMNTSGTNSMVVRISTVPSDLVNAANGAVIRFTPTAPASVTLTNSGAPGKDFGVGGSIAVTPATSDGVYTGNIEVTVDYQ